MNEKIKNHFKAYKNFYIGVGVGACVGAAVVISYALSSNAKAGATQRAIALGYKNEINQVLINLVERPTPSKPVHLVGTDIYFDSISDAARKTGLSLSRISKQINGHIPDVKGNVFELLKRA